MTTGNIFENTMIAENEVCNFYINEFTKSITDYCNQENDKGIALKSWYCMLAENKGDGKKNYILIDEKSDIIHESTSYEGILWIVDIHKLQKEYLTKCEREVVL